MISARYATPDGVGMTGSLLIQNEASLNNLLALRSSRFPYELDLGEFHRTGGTTVYFSPKHERVITEALKGKYPTQTDHGYGAVVVRQRKPPSMKETFHNGGASPKTIYTKGFRDVEALRRVREDPTKEPSTEPPTEREKEVAEIYRMHAQA